MTIARLLNSYQFRHETAWKENSMPFDVFISYSHKDKKLRDELITHLAVLRLQGLIRYWYDGDIVPGTEWEP